MSYCSVNDADSYFSARAFAEKWTGQNKLLYLETATHEIKQFCKFYDNSGREVFYDESTDEIPNWLKNATCEQALYLLNLGKDPAQPLKVHTLGILHTDDGTTFSKEFRPDVLCLSCRRILENNGGEIVSDATNSPHTAWGYFDK